MRYEDPELMAPIIAQLETMTVGSVLAAVRGGRPDMGTACIMLSWMLWANNPNRTEIDFATFSPTELLRMAEALNHKNIAYGSAAGDLAAALSEYALARGHIQSQ